MRNHIPLISVVMPTYNTPVSILEEAVNSILEQTIQDFEFIIVDDGSTNESREYLDGLTDPRIHVIHNEKNLGITKSLNIGFRNAKGTYVARMDGDDYSMPDRFEKQLGFMENHPEVIVCGSKVTRDKNDVEPYKGEMEDMERYRVRMLFANPGPYHPTAFFRHAALLRHQIEYNENLRYSQDYGMWMEASQYGRICVLPDKLLFFREHEGQVSKKHREEQIRCDKMTQKELLSRLVDDVTEREQEIHYQYFSGYYHDLKKSRELRKWCRKLIRANRQKGIYDPAILKEHMNLILRYTTKHPWKDRMRYFIKKQ